MQNNTFTSNLDHLNIGGALRRRLQSHEPEGVAWATPIDGNPSLNINGQPIYDPTNAMAKVVREIDGFLKNQDPDLVVFFGLGLGLHLQVLRLKTKAPILVFEPGLDIPASILPNIPMEFEDVTLITNTGHLIEAAGEILSRTTNKLAAGAITPYRNIFPGAFDEFCAALQQALKNIEINQSTRAQFADDWISHLAANLPALVRSCPLHALGPAFSGKPGILVGAGPSLDKNIEVLKKAQGRALICAVHTAVMPLAKAGIIPDLVVIIESQQLEYYFQDVPQMDRMVLAPAPHTHPSHLHMGFKNILTISMAGHPAADWFEQAYGTVPLKSGGSVACTAFSILQALGCDPIILVGMDAAFTGGRTHASDAETGCCRVEQDSGTSTMSFTYLDHRQPDGKWNAQTVTAWGGRDQVMTRSVFSSFRHWFEGAGQTWASDQKLINATEGGARFQGFVEMSLADALEKFAPEQVPVSTWLKEGLASGDQLEAAPLAAAIRNEISTVNQAMEIASKAEKEASKALKKLRARQLNTLQPVLDKLAIQETLLQKSTLQTRLLNTLMGHQAMALSAETPSGNDKVELTKHSVKKSREISRLVIQCGKQLVETFNPLIDELLDCDPKSE